MQCRPAVSASREPGAHLHVFQLRHCSACYADGGQEPTCRYLFFSALELMFVCVSVPVSVSISVLVSVCDFQFSISLSVCLSQRLCLHLCLYLQLCLSICLCVSICTCTVACISSNSMQGSNMTNEGGFQPVMTYDSGFGNSFQGNISVNSGFR